MEDLSVDILILACFINFSEYALPKRIMSGTGGDFISDKFMVLIRNSMQASACPLL